MHGLRPLCWSVHKNKSGNIKIISEEFNIQFFVFKNQFLIYATTNYNLKYVLYLKVGSDEVQTIGGNNARVFLLEYSVTGNGKWTKTESLNIYDPVHDIAFSPNVGRSYHILAVASKDLYIYSISPSKLVYSH